MPDEKEEKTGHSHHASTHHTSAHHGQPHERKHFDVAHPGHTPPSHTSRPVVVNHGPLLADPMMQAVAEEADGLDDPDQLIKATRGKVVPASDVFEAEQKAAQAEQHHQHELERADEDNNPSNEEALVDSVADQAVQRKQEDEAVKQAAEHAANVAALVEKKTYVVPINVAKRQRNTKLFIAIGVGTGLMLLSIFIATAL